MPDSIHILLIEDDHDDIEFFREALEENKVAFSLETLTRGDLIKQYLVKNGPLPHIIVMDLNLPKMHGRDVLCLIRQTERFSNVPVMILTTSSLPEDRFFCINKGADEFISKPSSPEGFSALCKTLVQIASVTRQIR